MKKRKLIILIFGLCLNYGIVAQEIAKFKDIYIDNDLLYKVSNDSLFTGICERKRKNGHVVLEEKIENGVILLAKYYFNGKEKLISDSIIYNPKKPYKLRSYYRFNKESEIIDKESYDEDGRLTLKEEFEDNKLVYSCQYRGMKKHGREFCYSKEGQPLEFEYINGKKVKNKTN